MDNDLIWLAHADRHIAASEQRVLEQRKRIRELERRGQDLSEAVMLLSRMLEMLNNYRRHRKLIVGQMAKHKVSEPRVGSPAREGSEAAPPKTPRTVCAPKIDPATLTPQVLAEIEQARVRRRTRALEGVVEAAVKYRAESGRGDLNHPLRLARREDALLQKIRLAYEAIKSKTRISEADVRMAEWSIKMRTLRAAIDAGSSSGPIRKRAADGDNVVWPQVWQRNASSE